MKLAGLALILHVLYRVLLLAEILTGVSWVLERQQFPLIEKPRPFASVRGQSFSIVAKLGQVGRRPL